MKDKIMMANKHTLILSVFIAFIFLASGCIGGDSGQNSNLDCNKICENNATNSSCISQNQCESFIENEVAGSKKKSVCQGDNVCCCKPEKSICESVCENGAIQSKCIEKEKCNYMITLGEADKIRNRCGSEEEVCCCK